MQRESKDFLLQSLPDENRADPEHYGATRFALGSPLTLIKTMRSDSASVISHGIEFTSTHIREAGDQASDDKIAVSEIRHCRFCYGSIVKYPKVQIVFGAVLISAFVVAFSRLLVVLTNGGRISVKLEASLLMFAFVGGWMIWDAWRKQRYIEITTIAGVVTKFRLLDVAGESAIMSVRSAAAEGSRIIM